MAAPRRYPDELRERAIRLAVGARRDPVTRSGALRGIDDQLGINPQTLRNWVTQAEIDGGHRPGTTTDDGTRLAELERENRELRRAKAMGIWTRRRTGHDVSGLVHHFDRGVQHVAGRYPQRLYEAGAVASVGSTGDSCDNALAEAYNYLFKAELVRNRGPCKGIDDLEIAVAEYIDWFDHRRLHGEIGLIPPAEHEDDVYRHNAAASTIAASVPSLH